MNNLTHLQRQMLGTIPRHSPLHNNIDLTVYSIGATNTTDLRELSEAADKVLAFSPSVKIQEEIKELAASFPKIQCFDSIVPQPCIMLIIDAHMNNVQSDSELAILQGFKAKIRQSCPYLFVRTEDPRHAEDLINYMDLFLQYDSWYVLKMTETNGIDQIWLVAAARILRLPSFDWEDARTTGHPRTEALVDLVITGAE